MTYRFEAFKLRVESEAPELARRADQVLRYHRFGPVSGEVVPDWTLHLRFGVQGEEPAWPVVLEASPCRLRRRGTAWWLRYGAVVFTGGGSEWTGLVSPGSETSPDLVYGLVLVLCLFLRERGWFGLHGAGLVYHGRGVLLVGRSDAGKSTLAYSLVRRGWHFLTDDALLIHRKDDGVEAVSFRKDFGLDLESVQYFPELAACSERQPTDPNKLRVSMGRRYFGQFCARCWPKLLIFPERTGMLQSHLHPLRPSEAFMRLLRAGLVLGGADNPEERHLLEIMHQLVQQAPAYRLQLGMDLLSQPERLEQLLLSTKLLVHETKA